ncbi:MAG: hypothetical protein ABIS43_03070 [Opitutus sp.]
MKKTQNETVKRRGAEKPKPIRPADAVDGEKLHGASSTGEWVETAAMDNSRGPFAAVAELGVARLG